MMERRYSLKKLWKKIMCIIVVGGIILWIFKPEDVKSYASKYEGINLEEDISGIEREDTYAKYKMQYIGQNASEDIVLDISNIKLQDNATVLDEYEGEKNVLMTEEESYVEWNVHTEKAGLYYVYLDYYPVPSRGVDIEREIHINGKIPFWGADNIILPRFWGDKDRVKQDNQGNDIRPSQIEKPKWNGAYAKDPMGYEVEPYMFYLDKGENTIGIKAVNEPMAIKKVTLEAIRKTINYDEYDKNNQAQYGEKTATDYFQLIQGEDSHLRTSPSLYATYDRSSPATDPYSVSKIKLNMGGGYAYRVAGQWIEWEFSVPEDNYYYIDIKSRQNYQRGFVSNRSVYIDGELPFQEAENIPFSYHNQWKQVTLGNEETPYRFYLTKGTHTIRLEVTMGGLGTILGQMEDSVFRLNEIYRKIMVLTGTSPDEFRDYHIETVYPEVIESMELESKRLYKIVDDVVDYTGQKAGQVAVVQTLATQLEDLVKSPYKIPSTLVNFKANIGALGTTILSMSESPLDIDSITIRGTKRKKDSVNVTFLDKAIHEIKSFKASFTEDYDAVGNVYEGQDVIDVWLLAGRDQCNVLKNLTDNEFVPNYNIKVNIKLVEPGSLLNAVIAGTGPDIVLNIGEGEPVNYALRNSVEDLTQFPDYQKILDRYHKSAYEPFCFEGGIYAIPETQIYNVLFYRTDIFEELGISVPETWQELINILPVIQQNNMSVAVPSSMSKSNPNPSLYLSMLYQNGGDLYSKDGKRVLLDDPDSISAFEMYTKFFTHYQLPQEYDFVNRFRSGEIPIGIQPYTMHNVLAVFAPEIRGLWDFALIPGTREEDGSINRSVFGFSTGSMMLKQTDQKMKEACWEFMKWWSGSDVQTTFGTEMESVLGSSARYATANKKAFLQLPWSSTQKAILAEQWEWVNGTEQVAGGYYTTRHITNAVRSVVNTNGDPRETLLDYTKTINEEIEKKRLEFHLDID